MKDEIPDFKEQRKSVRLVGSLTVELHFPESHGKSIKTQHGFTYDINKSGLGLEADHLDEEAQAMLNKDNMALDCIIHQGLHKKVRARCQVVWFQKADEMTDGKFLIGFKFIQINPTDLKLLLNKARNQTKWLGFVAAGLFILMIAFLAYLLS